MSKLVQFRIKHPEVWEDFKDAVAKEYHNQFGSIGTEGEEALILWMAAKGYGPYKQSLEDRSNSESILENNSVFVFSKKPKLNKNYSQFYDFLTDNNEGDIITFTAIKHFVLNTLGKTGRRTPHEYIDTMEELGVVEPTRVNKKGRSIYEKYRILIGISHPGKAMDHQVYSKSHNH